MPIYEYECENCGEFTALRAIAERDRPQSCPRCDAASARCIRTPPAFAGVPVALRHAHAVNERAAHEPRRISTSEASTAARGRSRAGAGSGGERPLCSSAHGRPWMIGH